MSTFPAFADCHSHAFHRALRGRSEASHRVPGRDFWGWRNTMWALADALDPDLYYRLARATFAEKRLAGIGASADFHYMHHSTGGVPYDDPNAMSEALIAAAADVGLRLCLIDVCYLRTGFEDEPMTDVQKKFSDGTAEKWAERVESLRSKHPDDEWLVIGTGIHSVRAVAPDDLEFVATAFPDAPVHVHLSEQPAENEACLATTGLTPTALLSENGVWRPRSTAVHATNVTPEDVAILGEAEVTVCCCPTTEAELADGIGPTVALREAGVRITLGSDSETVIDFFDEARTLAMHDRLATGLRDGWQADQLWRAATYDGYAALGFSAGDTFQISTSVRTAGATELLWAATANDVLPPIDPDAVAHDMSAALDEIWARV